VVSNIKFRYLYRDGSNFKRWSHVVFRNSEGLGVADITVTLRRALVGGDLFVAHQIQVPELFLYEKSEANSDDHCFHEFYKLEYTGEPPTDPYHRSAREFLEQVLATGWEPFDPFDREFRAP